MGIALGETERGIGRTSTIYQRRGHGVNLEVRGIGVTSPTSVDEIIRVPKEVRRDLFASIKEQFGHLGDHIVETIFRSERQSLARKPLPVEIQRVSNPTPQDRAEASRNSGVSLDGPIFIVRARQKIRQEDPEPQPKVESHVGFWDPAPGFGGK